MLQFASQGSAVTCEVTDRARILRLCVRNEHGKLPLQQMCFSCALRFDAIGEARDALRQIVYVRQHYIEDPRQVFPLSRGWQPRVPPKCVLVVTQRYHQRYYW